MILYDRSTGEIRARALDEDDDQLTDATLTCTLYDASPRPQVVFTDRVMTYDALHPFTSPTDLGCYLCTATAEEMTGPEGVWKAVITAVDALGNTLTIDAYINVTPFVAA